MPLSKLISRVELAEQLGISESGELRGRLLDPGWPAHIRIGQRVFYREAVVEQWLQDREARTTSPGFDSAGTAVPHQQLDLAVPSDGPTTDGGAL
ncbi:hypothetical protein GCM10010409_31130 [Mycolicibacterium diernhoferi]|uniref:DNA-binding protein n=1 Tax=Mycolicibacterium diernhoferi TaxID=1801 RepID=A0A1Q4HLP3_9MYCO|nr:hypothetical protein BRW64_02465 [Mycolicibacterium diernhoferi]PEG52089.1 hypothetical protein CRI78_23405 [Mycolicibacterium diernhoferi]